MDVVTYPQLHVDIETLSTETNAAIIQLGAAYFTSKGAEPETFLVSVSADWYHNNAHGFHISESTLNWWEKQSDKAKESLKLNLTTSPATMLTMFNKWAEEVGFTEAESATIWANSPSFDLAILRNMYAHYELPVPWKYYQERDVRTIVRTFHYQTPLQQVFTKHRADHDALEQGYKTLVALHRLERANAALELIDDRRS